jgi:hypothetical protein
VRQRARGTAHLALVYSDDGGHHSGSDDGINVAAPGTSSATTSASASATRSRSSRTGRRAVDFYGNEVLSAYDNAIELDTSEGNTRAFRNRFNTRSCR